MNIEQYSNRLTVNEVARIPFFYDAFGEDLEMLSNVLNVKKFKQNQYVFKEGDVQTGMYFIIDGAVKVLKRNDCESEVLLAELSAPQIFGEMALIDKGRRSASVIAVTDLIVAELTWTNFEQMMEIHPATAVHVIRKIALTLSLRLRKSSASIAHISH